MPERRAPGTAARRMDPSGNRRLRPRRQVVTYIAAVDRRSFLSLGLVGLVRLRDESRYGEVSPKLASKSGERSAEAGQASIDLPAIERARVLRAAGGYLKEAPLTITASSSPRSAGGRHDFFSEADYWWPDPASPGGPYIQRDGMTNPDNFVAHRRAMVRLSLQVPALAAAWQITREARYADHAARHLRAWFVDAATRMNPHLLYSQAIHGRVTGRGVGVIDTVHLVEVARACSRLAESQGADGRGSQCRSRMVLAVPDVDDDASIWHRREGSEEQSRHLLGDAGGGVCPLRRPRRSHRVLPQPLQDRAAAQPGGCRRQLP